jgi:hypothetical protein
MLAMLAALVVERERLRRTVYELLNCETCGGRGYDFVSVGEHDVEVEGCDCRIDAERVLGDWKPVDGH